MTVFFVGPQTGFQLKANIDSIEEKLRELYPSGKDFWGDLWECAARNQNEITEALRDNVAVIPVVIFLFLKNYQLSLSNRNNRRNWQRHRRRRRRRKSSLEVSNDLRKKRQAQIKRSRKRRKKKSPHKFRDYDY